MKLRARGITMSIAGWLWADLLLGAFVIFAVANTGGPGAIASLLPSATATPTPNATFTATPSPTRATLSPTAPGVDPRPLELTIAVNGAALLSGTGAGAEQDRVLAEATRAVGGRRVAIVLAYGTHEDLATGDRLAAQAVGRLRTGVFEGAAIRSFHNQVSGDKGSSVLLTVYLFQ